ncbi:molybdopterin-dependent oxidoreductase [Mycolicibacterium sp. 050158]|uniref:molybdopterin-dependent oxidoreductase n=1 Tax=Mycolicibacterium sp. 050158 TaxID=3090602 RepID=UPI0039A41A14
MVPKGQEVAVVGGGALLVAVLIVGQTVGGWLRPLELLLPRGRSHGDGLNDFQINRAAAAAGRPDPGSAAVSSLERFGAFNHARLQRNQVLHPDSLLALRVNGAELSADHGYPARIVVPALPGVHCTKWVASIDFRPPRVASINYLRMPTLAAGLTFLLFLPGIIRQGGLTYTAATGLTQEPYLGRWLLLVAGFYLTSAVCYVVRSITTRTRRAHRATR